MTQVGFLIRQPLIFSDSVLSRQLNEQPFTPCIVPIRVSPQSIIPFHNRMLKSLSLLTGLFLAATASYAQWATQPIGFPTAPAAPYFIKAVDATTIWTVGNDFDNENRTDFARSLDGGLTWTAGTVTGITPTTGYITALTAIDANIAWVTALSLNGARILKTTNAGATWVQQGTAFSSVDSYPNLIHFFNANEGIAQGDPLTQGGSFEVYRTVDGGTTWTPVTTPASLTDELGSETLPTTAGNAIWFGTLSGRVYRSTDKGLTWSVSDANLADGIAALSFRDAQNGLASSLDNDGLPLLKRTTDAGATWSTVNFTGPYIGLGLDNVPGTQQYIATGFDLSGTGLTGSSYSRDNGQTWVALESTLSNLLVDAVSPTAIWTGAVDVNTGAGLGMRRLTSTVLSSRGASPEQAGFQVYPNPSNDGHFVITSQQVRNGVQVQVTDALGRTVAQRTWQGSAATPLTFDLGKYKTGVYTLQLTSEAGVSRQKVVVQ
jgi:hypothetical protein